MRATFDKLGILISAILWLLGVNWLSQVITLLIIFWLACDLFWRAKWSREYPAEIKICLCLSFIWLLLVYQWEPIRLMHSKAPEENKLSREEILQTLKEGLAAFLPQKIEPKREMEHKEEQKSPAHDSRVEESRLPGEQQQLSIELAPRVLHYVFTYKHSGETGRQNEYGFGAIIRVRNEGKSLKQVKSLEITGDIDAGSYYHIAFGLGKTFDEIDIEYGKRKPYIRLSFVAFPINANKIEAGGEEFIRFMILDPTNLGTQGITRGAEAEEYIGFSGENAAEPHLLQTVPSISFFVKPTGFRPIRPGNDQWTGVILRDEIKSGRLRFTVRFNSGPQVVTPSKVNNIRLMGFNQWNKQTPQEIFFDMDHRFIPVTKDPLIERQ